MGNKTFKKRSGRRHYRRLMEGLERRIFLTGYTFTLVDQGTPTANGTYLQNVINGTVKLSNAQVSNHMLQLGDTLILPAGVIYQRAGSLNLPNLTGTGTLTIESSALASLPAGVRVGPSQASLMPRIVNNAGAIINTVTSDSFGHSGTPHDYAFLGIEIAPNNASQPYTSPFVQIGDGSSNQSSAAVVPYNFLIDRCYIHGLDTLTTDYKSGISLDAYNATVENSYISNIHNRGADSHAIGSTNGLGNFTVTNNFLEATGENFMMGGANIYLPNTNPTNVTITHNYFYKRPLWDDYDPAWGGVHMDVKNLFELKEGINVTIDQNIFDGNWVGADQAGFAIVLGGKNQNGASPWIQVAYVTITNNVVKNVGGGVSFGFDGRTTAAPYYTCQPMHDVVVRNNLFENINGTGEGDGGGFSISSGSGLPPGWNLTIDHNTVFSSNSIGGFDTGTGTPHQPALSSGFTFTNNIVLYAQSGLHSGPGEGISGMNIYCSGVTVTNAGSGYSTAPLVSFNNTGAGGSGATAIAFIDTTGKVIAIGMTNGGSGYTSAPTVVFDNTATSGSGATATAIIINGVVKGWSFDNNVVIDPIAVNTSKYPASTMFRNSEDLAGFRDTPGDDFSLLATINGAPNTLKNSATDGTDPGVDESKLSPEFLQVDRTLEGYWKFDDGGAGTTAADSTGHGHTGTLSSSSLWSPTGEMNTSLAFNGASGSVSIPTFAAPSSVSLVAWINPGDNTGHTGTILSKGSNEFILQVNSSGNLTATIGGATLTDTSFNYYSAANKGQWYLVGVTFDPTTDTMALYRDGVQVASGANSGAIADSGLPLWIGRDVASNSNSFLGSLDEVRYYTSALSASQMSWMYEGFGPLIDSISPGSAKQTGATSKLSVYALSHASAIPVLHQAPLPLTFTWSVYSQPPGVRTPTFDSNNGANVGQDCTVTYYAAGTYNFLLTVSDGLGGVNTALHFLTVTQTFTSISVTPPNPNVGDGKTAQFTATALDQFANAMSTQPAFTWSIDSGGIGSVDGNGLYAAPASGTGSATVRATSGAISGSANVTVSTTGDTTPPVVTAVYVDSTAWSTTFLNLIASSGKGAAALGYLMPTGPAQLNALPWSNINKISIVFSKNVNVTQAMLALTGANVASYNFSGFNLTGNTATWTINRSVPTDKLLLNLSSAVTDTAGNYLDGEWTDGVSTVSGNGIAGGNFQYHLKVLPGDASQNGTVDLTDLTTLSGNWQQPVNTWSRALTDFNGDGNVDLTDLTILSGDWQVAAPAIQVGGANALPASSPAVQSAAPNVKSGVARPLQNPLAVLGAASAIRRNI